MLLRPLHHLRRNVVAYCALAVAVATGGGYAIAASNTTTIHGCVGNRTHALYIQKRCHRGQRPLVWNQAAPSPVAAWAAVQANGFTGAGARGISVQHVSAGTYDITITPSQCAQVTDAPVVTVDTGAPPLGTPAGTFPVAWESFSSRTRFTIYTGVVAGGSFTPTDEAFSVQAPCS
jgi:hypothetical protein